MKLTAWYAEVNINDKLAHEAFHTQLCNLKSQVWFETFDPSYNPKVDFLM